MRILVIWGESLAKPGGGTTHLLGLGRGLEALGHQVRVITPRYGNVQLHSGGLEVWTVRLGRRGLLSFALFQVLSVMLLPWWIWRHRPHAIYVRTCFFQFKMAPISRLLRRPLVAEVDSVVDDEILMRGQSVWLARAVRLLDNLNNRMVSGLVCVSEGLRQVAISRGAKPATTAAIPNGAPTDVIKPGDMAQARRQFNLPADAVIIGFAGSFAPWQGLDLIIEAASRLADRRPELRIALLGGGRQEAQLRQAVADKGLGDTVIFLPPVPHEQVATFWNACDATVVIRREDVGRHGLCSPLKFYEALAAGLPVLTAGGIELVQTLRDVGVPGEFDPDDPDSLAGAMDEICRDVQRHRANRWQVHRAADERYSWLCVARQVAQLLERLTRRGGK